MYQYIGPKYKIGLLIPGIPGAQKPAGWNAKQIAAFQKRDPARFAKWFKEKPAKAENKNVKDDPKN